MRLILTIAVFILGYQTSVMGQSLALLEYGGGGDWYANPSSLKNLAVFANQNIKTQLTEKSVNVTPGGSEIFNYPFVHATGHGRIFFSETEAQNIRSYLESGGFLHIDDNYGMDPYVRPEMKKVFPELDFVEIPFSHPVYQYPFNFKTGLPKIHEHDGGAAKGYGLFYKGRLVCFYTFDCDLGDGWEDQEVHNNPETVRLKALQMGANLIYYVFNGTKKE